jgi:hypothetical protein
MTHPDRNTLKEFAAWSVGPIVSIFLPCDPQRSEPDPAALKSAAQWSEESLVNDHGLDPAAAAAILAPLMGAALAPAAPSRGAAWFLAPGRATCIALPSNVGPAVQIGTAPDTLRLLPFVSDAPVYYVLALSQRRVRLFRASRFDIEPIAVPDMPKGLDDDLWYVQRDTSFNRHGSGAMHAAGATPDDAKDLVHQYMHHVDRALAPVLAESHAPLVVVGIGYEAAMFINESHYRHIVETPVVGNADSLDVATIHARSWEIVDALPGAAQAASARAKDLAGTGRAVTDPSEIATAATNGAVEQFLVARSLTDGSPVQGRLDDERARYATALNAAVATGAMAFVVDDADLPAGAMAAAVLRY